MTLLKDTTSTFPFIRLEAVRKIKTECILNFASRTHDTLKANIGGLLRAYRSPEAIKRGDGIL
jgi:hypothetical protein